MLPSTKRHLKHSNVRNLRISTLANKARTVSMKITATGIQHQEGMQKALEDQFATLKSILDKFLPQSDCLALIDSQNQKNKREVFCMTCKFCIANTLVHPMCIAALRVNDMTFKGETVKKCLDTLNHYEQTLKASFSHVVAMDPIHPVPNSLGPSLADRSAT